MSNTQRNDGKSGAATASEPASAPGLIRSIAHRLAGDLLALPVEGRLASFDGATGWLNSDPLTPEGLRGRVVLVDFWTYTCINWLRTLPYVKAWLGWAPERWAHAARIPPLRSCTRWPERGSGYRTGWDSSPSRPRMAAT